jgi:hypothetical protein
VINDLLLPALGVAVFAAAVGRVVTQFAYTRERRIKRALRRVKTTLIADARDGKVVKVVGVLAYAGRTIPSALSQRPCACYSVVVEQFQPRGRGGRWHEVVREEKGLDFYLRDDSGVALVRLAGDGKHFAALIQDRKARTTPILRNDPNLERFLAERGHTVEGVLFRKNLRAYEGILEAGERVAVGGLARWVADPAAAGGNYRETPKRLVLESSESLGLFLSDDPAVL